MKFTELSVLLPCHSLEDFPVYHEGSAADELLAAWCALWHPALVAAVQAVPTWHRVDIPPEELAGRLITVPPFCLDRLPAGFLTRAEGEGAWLVRESSRDAAVAAALAGLDGGDPGLDSELVADFLALGFCRLQMELLTRQMRYSTNIDETHFQNEAVAAAQAAVAGDAAQARDHMQQCFDTLYESRKHFYPVDIYLIDVTLLADTTLGPPLAAELADGTPINLLAAAVLLEDLKAQHPDSWARLLAAIDAGTACVLGGDFQESELPLWPLETAQSVLRAGSDAYQRLLGTRPQVYARRRAGLWPGLVQLLVKLTYQGALHFTLDDGRFPLGPQCKSRWEGLETSVIDIFSRVPADAAKPESFLSLARTMSDSMDTDHVASVALAHWPGATSPWYADLRRVCRLSPVLGKFMLLDDYFMHTDMPGRLSKFAADEYRTPYLKQAIIRRQGDPISSFAGVHRAAAARAAVSAVSTVADLVAGTSAGCAEPLELDAGLARLSAALPRENRPAAPRALVFNPAPYSRRMGVELSGLAGPPAVQGAVVAAGASGQRNFAVVDVPSLGFAWLEPAAAPSADGQIQPIAAENALRNEFFEVKISPVTGGIQSLFNYNQRGNRLSQQIAFRLSGDGTQAAYTTMRADAVEVTAACAAYGEIQSAGELVDAAGKPLARFRQITSIWAGSPLVRLSIELSDLEEPRADPWNSYYAARFAWGDELAQLWRGVSLARQKTDAGRLEAPEFVDVESGGGTLTILTGGLPYHRRSDPRMLDSLLVVRGETARRFELAIGVDLPYPAAAALDFITPQAVHYETTPPAAGASGWFFHAGTKNVVATHWAPIVDDQPAPAADNAPRQVKGFRARLLEIAGTGGRVPLHAFRPLKHARQVDFLGNTILELSVDDDKIMLDFGPHEFLEVEALWTQPAKR
jgi:alpha-mannosidase